VEAIILAGGKGTRLTEVVSDVAKPMAPINGKPFLWYLFQWLKIYPIEKVVLSTGYLSESISDYFGTSFGGIPIAYATEEKPLGTGGAIKFALSKTKENNLLIINGDTYFPIDINSFYSFHCDNNYLFSIALKHMLNFSRYGSVVCKDNTILKFNEKKNCREGLINAGVYLINREYFNSKQVPEVFSLEKHIMEKDAGSGIIKGKIFDNVFVDIGIPGDYHQAQSLLTPPNE
jgi:D-glycero-alpha-D-manno-heptose 1-phosphate guanylyltransferase